MSAIDYVINTQSVKFSKVKKPKRAAFFLKENWKLARSTEDFHKKTAPASDSTYNKHVYEQTVSEKHIVSLGNSICLISWGLLWC